MKHLNPPLPKPGSAWPGARSSVAVWTAIGALAATAALGIAAPRFVGHAQARTESAAPRPLAAPLVPSAARPVPSGRGEGSVPPAGDVFAKPERAPPAEAQAPTF